MVEGLSRAGVDRLPHLDNAELDDVDRLVVEYTIAVTNDAQRIPERLFDWLRARFSEAQIVELTLRIALCGFFNRFNEALQIDDELAGAAQAEGAVARGLSESRQSGSIQNWEE